MAFRVFRIAVGLILVALAAWTVGTLAVQGLTLVEHVSSGGVPTTERPSLQELWSSGVLSRALLALAGLVLYYLALWANTSVRKSLENIFAIPELLKKLAFTLGLLCIYRIGFYIPLPGLDQEKIMKSFLGGQEGPLGQAIQMANMFTGGNLQQATLFGLGIMPYISASIIFQLMATIVPALQKLQKEGPAGYKKIQEYTRYATVALCLVQAIAIMSAMMSGDPQKSMVYPDQRGSVLLFMAGVLGLTAGTMFLMWLGEQIDEYGIGNGISLLIMAGIVARMPSEILKLGQMADLSVAGAGGGSKIGPVEIIFLMLSFVFVVAGAILITQAQRRIPVQQAKHTRGRRVVGGQRHYMPLRVNHGGVMPLIFASSLMIIPNVAFRWLEGYSPNNLTHWLASAFNYGGYSYTVLEIAMIFFFAYFWTTVQFRPKEMAEQLRDYGSFIPGLRPGKRTSDYLERVMERITYCGAAFLSVIAVIPMMVANSLHVPFGIAAFLGGTGLLIVVSVCLDLVQRIEANLVMRNYGGFLGGSTRIKGAYT